MRMSAKYIILPTLFLIAVFFVFVSTAQVSVAIEDDSDFESEVGVGRTFNARKTSADTLKSLAGNVKVVNAVCQPPGPGRCTGQPKKPGRDGFPCPTNNLVGGSITGTCQAGVCTVVAFSTCTSPTFTTFAESLKQNAANQVIQSLVQNVMQKLMGGGAAGGGGGSFSGANTSAAPEIPNLLSIDPSLTPDDSTGGFLNLNNLLFGSNDTTDTVNNDTTNDVGDTNPTEIPVQAGDTVETTYEQVVDDGEGDGFDTSTDTPGTPGTPKDFTEDLFDPSFLDFGEDSSSSGSLTRADLERQGLLEAARFQVNQKKPQGSLAISYESLTPAEIRSLQDYQSSGVAVSGNLNPFQNQNNADQPEQEQQDGFFRKLGKFFSILFGIGPPAQ